PRRYVTCGGRRPNAKPGKSPRAGRAFTRNAHYARPYVALWNLTLWKGNPMSPSTLDIQALINAGANLTIDAATYGQLERLGFVRLAANKKVQIVFTNAVKVSQLDRLALVNAAPGLVGLDFS
ncbi:hypothetical protein ACOAOR_29470, partial [Pseudomonas aeruginosa]